MLDLREWIKTLEERHALRIIKGLHWNLEITAALRVLSSDPTHRGPDWAAGGAKQAFIFDDIVGYPSGYRVMTNHLPTPRLGAICLGLPESDSMPEVNQAVRQKLPDWEASLSKFAPKVVKSGPILENVDSGKDVDLFKFPTPKWGELDGGRFIGVGNAFITRDPGTGEINLGQYRNQILDEKTVGIYFNPNNDGLRHIQDYHAQGEACPVAISVGHHPLIGGLASTKVPLGTEEYNLAGAISGEPVSVIKEEVTGLPIPAASEIVIAGWCPPGETRYEGPFGEWSGYYGAFGPAPFVKIERIYHRNNPIICGGGANLPGLGNALTLARLVKSGVTDVRGVSTGGFAGGGITWLVISIKQRYAGQARQAALVAQAHNINVRYIIVVDEDIDINNMNDVLWAIGSRSDPEKDILIIPGLSTTPICLAPIRTPSMDDSLSRVIIDACRPFDYKEFPKVITWNPETLERVKQKIEGLVAR